MELIRIHSDRCPGVVYEYVGNIDDKNFKMIRSNRKRQTESKSFILPGAVCEYMRNLDGKSFNLTTTGTKRKRVPQRESFKNALQKIRRTYRPELQVSSDSLDIFDKIIYHFLELFDMELRTLKKVRNIKMLTINDLENATKLCLPKMMRTQAIEKGIRAVFNRKR